MTGDAIWAALERRLLTAPPGYRATVRGETLTFFRPDGSRWLEVDKSGGPPEAWPRLLAALRRSGHLRDENTP